ncbi:MAG: dihydrofolate reductase family protein [Hyphomonadaceae bacterium]
MSRVRVNCFSVSLDGYSAGPNQSLENPLGERGPELHNWFFPTETVQKTVFGKEGGTKGIDNDFAIRSFENVGAWILGRNMFAHSRGPWPENDPWQGWWGDTPPYHCDVFVLTHHPRKSFALADTTFHFETGGIHAALDKAKAAAKGQDVRIGGGASTIRQYLQAGLIDEMHIAVSPVVFGKGEPLFNGIDLPAAGMNNVQHIKGENAAHYILSR